MAVRKYQHLADGQRVTIPNRVLKIACCDCGLVHLFKIRKRGRGLAITAWRDVKATRGKRAARARHKA